MQRSVHSGKAVTTLCHDPRMGVMTRLVIECKLSTQRKVEDGCVPAPVPRRGGISGSRGRREAPVLDGSIIQLKRAGGGARPRRRGSKAPILMPHAVPRARIFGAPVPDIASLFHH